MKRAQPGFTLLELMLVVAIAGVLAAIAIPAMGNFIRNSRITSAANDVMAGLHFTRSEAIKRRQSVTLCTSADPLNANPACDASSFLTGWIAFVDLDPIGVLDAGDTVLLQHEPMPATITAAGSRNPLQITYLMNGFAEEVAPLWVVLCDERGNAPSGGELSAARAIEVAVTGRAGVTRALDEIQDVIDDLGGPIAGCTVS